MLLKEYVELGCSPCEEDCVQVSKTEDYMPAMRAELKRWKELLEQTFPIPENIEASFRIKFSPHDFGSYGEVWLYYDPDDEQSVEFMLNVEKNAPKRWDSHPGTLRAHFAGVHGVTLSDDAIEKKYPQDEWDLRKLWASGGVPVEKQDRLIAEIDAKAQPGARVGPWVIGE